VAEQDFRPDRPIVLRRPRQDPGVEADYRGQGGADPGQLDRRRAAEAIADRRQSRAIDARVVDQHLESRLAQSPESRNVGAQLLDDRLGALQIELGQAEQIHGEGHMAELGEPGRPLPGMPAKAAPFVDDEDTRRRFAS
jgi:hypothetical protein